METRKVYLPFKIFVLMKMLPRKCYQGTTRGVKVVHQAVNNNNNHHHHHHHNHNHNNDDDDDDDDDDGNKPQRVCNTESASQS